VYLVHFLGYRIADRETVFQFLAGLVSGFHPTSCPMGTGGSLTRSKVNLTTDLHLVPRVKTSGATVIILHTPAWCAQEYKI